VNDLRADFRPWTVWAAHKAHNEGRPGARALDVALVAVSPPNKHGYCCFGNALWDQRKVALEARTTIAAVDPTIPATFGDTWIPASAIDWFVEIEPLAPRILPPAPTEPWEPAIAGLVSTLVHDGDTIQLGLGSTTAAVARLGALDAKHDLAYWGELTVPGTVNLVRQGVINGRRSTTHPGKFIAASAGNSPEDIAFIANNPTFEFYEPDYVHNPMYVARNDDMVAINNALSVDLTGQIAAGEIGHQTWSGTGGQLPFAIGAFMSKGGRSITVLPSTAVGGTVSRVVAQFAPGQIVTVPRDIADIIVTEYGIAHLLGKTQRQRAEELIAIAHPDFRAELRREASRLFGL
jgi:4-hydroxybutyrate CoA-transferase